MCTYTQELKGEGRRSESGREKRVREGEESQGEGNMERERERGEGVERLCIKLSLDVFNMN